MIEVRNLVKKYGNHLAVDHLDFTLEAGRIYGFLGPNGAGKSTTMNIMTGYLGATEGEVLIDGHDILKEPEEAKKHIGYLPEQPPLYMDMTVREYLRFAAELKKIPRAKREEIPSKNKSGGAQRRALFAPAIVVGLLGVLGAALLFSDGDVTAVYASASVSTGELFAIFGVLAAVGVVLTAAFAISRAVKRRKA